MLITKEFSLVILFVTVLFLHVSAIRFHLKPNGKMCLREEIHKDVLVTGDYELSEAPGQKANIKVF